MSMGKAIQGISDAHNLVVSALRKDQNRAHAAIRALMAAYPDWENDEQCAAVREAEAVLAAADTGVK